MKKLFIVLAIGAFAACNSNTTDATKTGDTTATEAAKTVDTAAKAVDTAAKAVDTTAKAVDTLKK